MITIITGVPGMGKTALTVSMLLKEYQNDTRPIFTMGINGLKLECLKCPPVIDWTYQKPDLDDSTLMLDTFTFPKGSLIIIDEAQKVFPARSSASKVPPHSRALETHRHLGLDFWLITQKPNFMDSHVRDLADKHIHLGKNLIGQKKLYEWPEYRDVKVRENMKEAVKRSFRPPREAFQHYHSAEIHTKTPTRIHNVFFLLVPAVAFTLYMGFQQYQKFSSRISPQEVTQNAEKEPSQTTQHNIKPDYTSGNVTLDDGFTTSRHEKAELPHPYLGYTFSIKATIRSSRKSLTYYEVTDGERFDFLTDADLKKLGYNITQNTDCSAFLFFNGAQILATCSQSDLPSSAHRRAIGKTESKDIYNSPAPLLDASEFSPSPA